MPFRVPEPPDQATLEPLLPALLRSWPAGRPFHRVHHAGFGATEFNPGCGQGRFHPFQALDGGHGVPTLYGAEQREGAFAETVFHGVFRGSRVRRLRRRALLPYLICTLAPKHELHLLDLSGLALARLSLSRERLLDCGAAHYPRTALWASALHGACPAAAGLLWVSSLYDRGLCLLLFGDRVGREALSLAAPPVPLHDPPGYEWVRQAAALAGILLIES